VEMSRIGALRRRGALLAASLLRSAERAHSFGANAAKARGHAITGTMEETAARAGRAGQRRAAMGNRLANLPVGDFRRILDRSQQSLHDGLMSKTPVRKNGRGINK
jgi:hypothetical protein